VYTLLMANQPRLGGVRLLSVGLAVVLVVQALFVLSYVGALHTPKPHHVAFGVVGRSALPVAVGTRYSLRVSHYPSEQAAMTAIDNRKIYGAFVAAPGVGRLIVVPAGGPGVATALSTAFGTAAAALHQKIAVVQIHPLPSGDELGNVSFLLAMALIIGGYIASTIASTFGGSATRHGRLAALTIVSVIGALLTDVFAGPVLGATPTSKFLALWAIFILAMTAVAFSTAALQTVLGPAGTLVVVVVFVIFGAPASGGPLPSAYLPTFWRTFGPYLPAGAATTTIRNTLYFDANNITRSLLILSAYLVAGALTVAAVRNRRPMSVGVGEAEASAAAAAIV
jgi:hypothetical protein